METDLVEERIASVAATFPEAVEAAAMHSEAVLEATTGPALARTAVAVRPAWGLEVEAEASAAAAVVAVAVAVGVAGRESRATLPGA